MSEENKAVVRRYIEEGLNQRNLVIFEQILGPDFANYSPRLGILGREETIENFAQVLKGAPDRHSTIEDIIAEGDKVFLRTTAQGTHRDRVQGISVDPPGKQITWTVWEVFRFSGGKIVERRAAHDLREQLSAT